MRKMTVGLLVLLLLTTASSVAMAGWSDHFPSPTAIGPGEVKAPGTVLTTLTPELAYMMVGSLNYVYVFADEGSPVTLGEELSKRRIPVLMARVNSSSLQIPSGILLPGKSYYWYVQSTHSPGSKSEATNSSQWLYFSTPQDSK